MVTKDSSNNKGECAVQIAGHFAHYFEPVIALSPAQRELAYRIRHQVYCEELHYEPEQTNRLETDEFDHYSEFCLIRHKRTGADAGTVRMVRPNQPDQQLPISLYCQHALQSAPKRPEDYPQNTVCEISRLAVPVGFRRRQTDGYEGAATGVINESLYSEIELRCFPLIAIGLYLSAAAMCHELLIEHVFVMMEPRLARSMRFVGIRFEQLGPAVNYHGKRAPYYIQPQQLIDNLSEEFLLLFDSIEGSIRQQIQYGKGQGLMQ